MTRLSTIGLISKKEREYNPHAIPNEKYVLREDGLWDYIPNFIRTGVLSSIPAEINRFTIDHLLTTTGTMARPAGISTEV